MKHDTLALINHWLKKEIHFPFISSMKRYLQFGVNLALYDGQAPFLQAATDLTCTEKDSKDARFNEMSVRESALI